MEAKKYGAMKETAQQEYLRVNGRSKKLIGPQGGRSSKISQKEIFEQGHEGHEARSFLDGVGKFRLREAMDWPGFAHL